MGLCILWFYVREHLTALPVVVLVWNVQENGPTAWRLISQTGRDVDQTSVSVLSVLWCSVCFQGYPFIENTRWVSFDIKFTRQGFENACWHREACRAIQHAFSKPSLVNLISKDANLVFYLSVCPLLNALQTSDYGIIFDVCVDLASLATSFEKCNVIMTW